MTPLPPRITQYLGIVVLLFSVVFWAVTGRQSIEFVSAAMTLITLGGFWSAASHVSRSQKGYDDESEGEPKRRRLPRKGRARSSEEP